MFDTNELSQKRIILFAHDSKSLGHLSRISKIAAHLQGECACLILSGIRDASWIVPRECELVRLPGWDRISGTSRETNGIPIWLKADKQTAQKFRSDRIGGVIRSFAPDAIIVDYLPFGQREELKSALQQTPAKKYLVLRGIIDTSDFGILCGSASDSYSTLYDRIFITADKRVIDVASRYSLNETAKSKISYVGYVSTCQTKRAEIRKSNKIKPNRLWVICSAGGGFSAEELIRRCIEVAPNIGNAEFFIVPGPNSNIPPARFKKISKNCRVLTECHNLPELHAACDVLVTTGGYNSVIEAAAGGARIITYPNQTGTDDEQKINAGLLSKFYPIKLLKNLDRLESELTDSIVDVMRLPKPAFNLDLNAGAKIKEIILKDLEFSKPAFAER